MKKMDTIRYGMVLDLRKCIGCDACMVACKMENETARNEWRTKVHEIELGSYPNVSKLKIPTLCNHCEDPPCVEVCPVGATYVNEAGVVLVNDRCISCGYCITVCPYEARFKDEDSGKVNKCTYCYHRVDVGLMPTCVSNCVSHCRVFGDLNDPNSYISQYIAENNGVQVTPTSTYYIIPGGVERDSLPQDLKETALIKLWQKLARGTGKTVLGLTAGAVVLGTITNKLMGRGENEEQNDESTTI